MKVAISTDNGQVSGHFGRCPEFTISEINDNTIVNTEQVKNPGHEPGLIPQFLSRKGVNCIIAGGMGMKAQELFASNGIQVIMGVTGEINTVLNLLCKGELQGGASMCSPGEGKGYGVDKTVCDHSNHEEKTL